MPTIKIFGEGDSWFNFFPQSVMTLLDDVSPAKCTYKVADIAKRGDTLYEIARMDTWRLERDIKAFKPHAVLLSAGGNDFLEMRLREFVLPYQPGGPYVNGAAFDLFLEQYCAPLFAELFGVLRKATAAPVVIHGYDRVVPDGRATTKLSVRFAGPWLKPVFDVLGYPEDLRMGIIHDLLDRFNDSQQAIAQQHAGVHYLDLRGTLRHDQHYKQDWDDELHPTVEGFKKITARFDAFVRQVTGRC